MNLNRRQSLIGTACLGTCAAMQKLGRAQQANSSQNMEATPLAAPGKWEIDTPLPKAMGEVVLPHVNITRHGFAAAFLGNTLHVVGGSFQSDGMPGIYSPTATHETFTVGGQQEGR